MCKIFLVINKNKEVNQTVSDLVTANITNLSAEQDGYSVFRDDISFFYDTDLAYKNIESNLTYRNEQLYIVHTRTSTGGSQGIAGLHLQTLFKDWVYAHNGIVDKFSGVAKHSDSYYFFKHYLKKYKGIVDPETINSHSQDTGFSGKGVLYNKKTKDLYFFNNVAGQITILDDCLILSSYDIETKKKEYEIQTVLGYSWYKEYKEVEISGIVHQSSIDNTYLHFKDGQLIDQAKFENKSYSQSGYYGGMMGDDYEYENGVYKRKSKKKDKSFYKDKEEEVFNQLKVLE